MDIYALFTFNGYYPEGGWSDFFACYSDAFTAETVGKHLAAQDDGSPNEFHWQVVNLSTHKIVIEGRSKPYSSADL